MRVLITGITGFAGSHLADYILENHPDVAVHGFVRPRSPRDHILHLQGKITLWHGDLRDSGSVHRALGGCTPDWIFHLAAQSLVPYSFEAPAETLETNTIGTLNLLEAVRSVVPKVRMHIASSSEVYGQVSEDESPITEDQPFRPANPYAVSKAAQDLLGFQYFRYYGLHVVRTRAFTLSGPRRGDMLAESSFAKQIAEREAGLVDPSVPIRVGNLDSVRTITHVRDMIRAYWQALEQCPAGEVYNVGGGRSMTMGEILEYLKSQAKCPIEHQVEPSLLRLSDVTLQIPDCSKFQMATSWKPMLGSEQSLLDLLDYHRERTKRNQV